MSFVLQKVLDHGTENPIVARLSLQIFQILDQCNLEREKHEAIGNLYLNSLQRKLLRCWEIKERFREGFNVAAETYEPSANRGQTINIPNVSRLEEECHNFLYEIKNYIRDLLQVWNLLYGTNFSSASEFSGAQGKRQSLIAFAANEFGERNPKTVFLQEAATIVEYFIGFRNAVEHPGGYSGELRINDFSYQSDGKLREPIWYTEKDGKSLHDPSSIRVDMDIAIPNFLVLGEDILVSWAVDNLALPEFMQLAVVASEKRDAKCPIKWVVTPKQNIQEQLGPL